MKLILAKISVIYGQHSEEVDDLAVGWEMSRGGKTDILLDRSASLLEVVETPEFSLAGTRERYLVEVLCNNFTEKEILVLCIFFSYLLTRENFNLYFKLYVCNFSIYSFPALLQICIYYILGILLS